MYDKKFKDNMKITISLLLAAAIVLTIAGDFVSAAGPAENLERLLVYDKNTPGDGGILAGLEEQLTRALEESTLAADAEGKDMYTHLEKVINILEGKLGENYNSAHPDGGDGFGVMMYVDAAAGEVDQAMNASGSGSIIREHGIHVQKALKNTRGWVSEAVRHALYGLSSPNPVGAVTHAGHVKKWLGKAYSGTDMNFDGQVSWVEGGLKTVLSHVKLMKGPTGNP